MNGHWSNDHDNWNGPCAMIMMKRQLLKAARTLKYQAIQTVSMKTHRPTLEYYPQEKTKKNPSTNSKAILSATK